MSFCDDYNAYLCIAQRDRLNSNIANLKADVEKAGYEIGEDDNGKFLARKLKRKVDKIYL